MRRRGFTLIEVLMSLAIFALAAVGLGAAYSNVLLGRAALRQNEQDLEDMSRVRAALMENPNFDEIEAGGEIHLPGDRTARWKGKIEPTTVSDLFTVTLTAEIQAEASGEYGPERTEVRMLLRPTWSIPSDRSKIRDDVRQRLERERGYTESNGNSGALPKAGAAIGKGGAKGGANNGKGKGQGKTGQQGQGGGQGKTGGNNPGGGNQPPRNPAPRPPQ